MDVGITSGPARPALRRAVGALLLAFVLTSCASRTTRAAVSADGEPAGTAVRTFAAYDPSGVLTVPVAGTASGSCFTGSAAAPVAGAYRCFAGNRILDPCFAAKGGVLPTTVACVADPWSHAVVLTLTKALPADPAATNRLRPWAFVLGSGVRCVASTGTVPAVAGVNLAYRCTDGTSATIGTVAAAGRATVTASYGRPGGKALHRSTVRVVWRA